MPRSYLEREIDKNFCQDYNIVPVPHPCPYNSSDISKRNQIKQWLNELSSANPTIKGNLLKSVLKDQLRPNSSLSAK